MKKAIILFICFVAIICHNACCFASSELVSEYICEGYRYIVLDSERVEITGYDGTESQLIIPSKLNGYEVFSIGAYAFESNDNILSVFITDGIEIIEEGAFAYCLNLNNIDLPESILYIGEYAFAGTDLGFVILPNRIERIEDFTFSECFNMEFVRLPAQLEHIGLCAFAVCDSLTAIAIPEGVLTIEESAFMGCRELVAINIPDSVVEIGTEAFNGCESLEIIAIPSTVQNFGTNIFNAETTLLIEKESMAEYYALEEEYRYIIWSNRR